MLYGACSFAKYSAVRWNVCRMYGIRYTVRTSGLYSGEEDRPNVPIGESSNTPFQSAWLC